MPRGLWWVGLMVLAGCQAVPTHLPEAEPAPAAECSWTTATPPSLARVAGVLEARGFLLRDTDTALGLVSAERAERSRYHNAPYPGPRIGGFLFGGSDGHIGSGVTVGFGGIGPVTEEATQLERVSVVVANGSVRVSRDLRLFDWRGDLRRARTASDPEFCRQLRAALEEMTP